MSPERGSAAPARAEPAFPDQTIALLVASTSATTETTRDALKALCCAFGWGFGALWIFDRRAGALRYVSHWGDGALDTGEFAQATRRLTFATGMGLPGRVWAAWRPIWLPDATVEAGFARADEASHEGLHTAVAFPVQAGGEPLGVLEFFGARVSPPDEALLATMNTVGALIGQQIQIQRGQEALSESESLRAAIVEGADDAIISEDLDQVIVSWNAGAERMFGYSAAEAIGRPTTLIIPPERSEDAAQKMAAVRRGEHIPRFEAVVLRKDGTRFDVCLGVSPLRRPGGAIFGASIIARDITDRKQVEDALRCSEERWRSLAKATSFVVWDVGADGASLGSSPSWEAYTGQDLEGSIRFGWLDAVHPDDRERIRTIWSRLAARPRVFEEDLRVWNAAAGRYRHCVGRGVPMRDAAGLAYEWIGTLTDVDDRRRAEDTARFLADATTVLARSLDYEQTLAQVARLAIPVLADVCTVHMVDEGGVHMVALAHRDPAREDEIRARRQDLGAQCAAAEVVEVGRTKVMSGPCAACASTDAWGEAHGGAHLCVPMFARGRTLGALCFVRLDDAMRGYEPDDVALAEELARRAALAIDNAKLYRVAQRAAQAREEFLVIASHELHTPLAPLKLAVQSLLKHARAGWLPSGRSVELLAAVERCTDRLGLLVDELLDVAWLSSERLDLVHEPVDLASVVADVLARSQRTLADAGCSARVDTAGVTSGRWDRRWLEKAIARLVANAAKYGHGRPVEIGVSGKDDAVRVAVRDHGFGISPEEQTRIFDRFERAVSTRHYGGFGFGLWCVRRIVEAHHGAVRVESIPGEGATFTIELPRAA